MSRKEIRINNEAFDVYDWSETFTSEGTSPSTGQRLVGRFKVTLAKNVGVGSLVEMEGEGADRYGVVEWTGPPDGLGSALGEFMVRGSLIRGSAQAGAG
jgi:hypothetical protein